MTAELQLGRHCLNDWGLGSPGDPSAHLSGTRGGVWITRSTYGEALHLFWASLLHDHLRGVGLLIWWLSVETYSIFLLHCIGYEWIVKAAQTPEEGNLWKECQRTCSHVLKSQQPTEVLVTA